MSGSSRPNPWTLVPAADYEASMGKEGAGELAPLSALFGKAYAARRPARLALLGVATGNGLEHVDPAVTRRAVGVDVNLSYLAVARQRFMRLGASLQLLCADAEQVELEPGGFDLVHAALVLEFLDPRVLLPRLASWLAPGGAFSVVLALPGAGPEATPPATAPALRAVAEARHLVPPEELRRLAAAAGLAERRAFVVPLPSGRRLFAALYGRGEGGRS
ncbi:MAG TPA: class I SAM-dependent methyltransferase [Anaeromyxobacteraceae bacterium]